MIEDLKSIASKIDLLWDDIRRVRDELAEYPGDTDQIDQELYEAATRLVAAWDRIRLAQGGLEALQPRQDWPIAEAIALLESKGFVVGTKT